MLTAAWLLPASLAQADAPAGPAEPDKLIADLSGPDALAEHKAAGRLVELGDAVVPALSRLIGSLATLAPRLRAVELLGQIGTPAAIDALLERLRLEKHLAVRGQLCMQLGYAGEKRAVPIIAEHLATIGPRALDDVRAPKESLASTCYLRHIEALAMIGDERAIPILEDFAKKIPKGIGHGGFVSHFVSDGVREALEDLREKKAFWDAVRRQPGLETKIEPLFAHFRADRLARFRLHADEVIRRTARGRAILTELAGHAQPALADAARALLARLDSLGKEATP